MENNNERFQLLFEKRRPRINIARHTDHDTRLYDQPTLGPELMTLLPNRELLTHPCTPPRHELLTTPPPTTHNHEPLIHPYSSQDHKLLTHHPLLGSTVHGFFGGLAQGGPWTTYPPPPPDPVNTRTERVKTPPSLLLRMRSVIKVQ